MKMTSIQELVVKTVPNHGLLNSGKTLCWFNAAVQLLDVTSIPICLTGMVTVNSFIVITIIFHVVTGADFNVLSTIQKTYIKTHRVMQHSAADPTDFIVSWTENPLPK